MVKSVYEGMYVRQRIIQMLRLLTILPVVCGLAAAGPAMAQTQTQAQTQPQTQGPAPAPAPGKPQSANSVRGVLEASVLDRLPADAAFRVRPADASPMAQAMRDVFIAALRDHGYAVGPDKPYLLSFKLTGDIPQTGKRPDIELVGEGGSHDLEDVNLKMRWRLRRQDENREEVSRLLLVTVSGPDHLVVWDAQVALKPTSADELTIADTLAPGIVAQIGQQTLGRALP
jgi:hypothetical protein